MVHSTKQVNLAVKVGSTPSMQMFFLAIQMMMAQRSQERKGSFQSQTTMMSSDPRTGCSSSPNNESDVQLLQQPETIDDVKRSQKRCSRKPTRSMMMRRSQRTSPPAIPVDRWGPIPKDTSRSTPLCCCSGDSEAPTDPANSAVTISEGVTSGNLKRFLR